MIADYHLHTFFSGDSEADPHDMADRAIALGMTTICFTDHCDTDSEEPEFILATEKYIPYMLDLREEYRGRLDIRIGVELGLQTHLAEKHNAYVEKWPFDFVIASRHLVDGIDPYYEQAFEGKEDGVVYRNYLEQLLENLKVFHNYQAAGHIDYVVRYGRHKARDYNCKDYADVVDAILHQIIEDGNGIEVNSAGLSKGLDFPNPHYDIVKRYKELGGEYVTIGSDAHEPGMIGAHFLHICDFLKSVGFRYLTDYEQKIPKLIQI